MGQRRLLKQWNDWQKDPFPGIKIFKDLTDPFLWSAVMDGGQNSPYQGGKFYLKIQIPFDYPFRPPKIHFVTKIYHPGVLCSGRLCCCYINAVTEHQWSPGFTIKSVLKYYQQNLMQVSMKGLEQCGANAQILNQYKFHRSEFQKVAKQWTKKYANKDQTGVGSDQNKCKCCLQVISPKDIQITLGCSHRLHSKCLKNHQQRSCPICHEQF